MGWRIRTHRARHHWIECFIIRTGSVLPGAANLSSTLMETIDMTDTPASDTFPLKQASLDSVHEKNVQHGHISTLHIWPARPVSLAACRRTHRHAASIPAQAKPWACPTSMA